MANIITTDHLLTETQRALLTAVLDTLVPANENGTMPSAAEVGFENFLTTQATDFEADLVSALEYFDITFVEMPLDGRCQVVMEFSNHNPLLFQNLLARVYDCYYQHDQVREQIGMVTGAVFPQGNEVMAGDLSLLDPVLENRQDHGYRAL